MTQMQCLDILREIRALEGLAAALSQPDKSPEWQYVLTLIDHRLHWLRVSLSQVDPLLIQSCEHLRMAGILWPAPEGTPPLYHTDASPTDDACEGVELTPQMSERPAWARVH